MDLTTLLIAHLIALRVTTEGGDLSTLVSQETGTIRASNVADYNTAYLVALSA
jgi:hypothetical protein